MPTFLIHFRHAIVYCQLFSWYALYWSLSEKHIRWKYVDIESENTPHVCKYNTYFADTQADIFKNKTHSNSCRQNCINRFNHITFNDCERTWSTLAQNTVRRVYFRFHSVYRDFLTYFGRSKVSAFHHS